MRIFGKNHILACVGNLRLVNGVMISGRILVFFWEEFFEDYIFAW
jgi:hypothetical protein